MKETLVFWLVIESLGILAFPITFAFFRGFYDRGYAFSKAIGLLLISYLIWISASAHVLPNSRGSLILLLGLLAGVSAFVAWKERAELGAFLRVSRFYVLVVEALFLSVFAVAVFLRSFSPDIIWGEKPFELAFINAINRAEFFPPEDPWLSGHSIAYYYFGYVQAVVLTKLSGLGTETTFYLTLCSVAALSAVGIFGLVYNLIASSDRRSSGTPEGLTSAEAGFPGPFQPRAAIFGIVSVFLLLLVSNLAGVFELLARHGIGSGAFYDWVGIDGLEEPYDCSATPEDCRDWYPTQFFWWWKATRMGSAADIQEFPFFSFHFGDLHAHVMALPFLILAAAVAFQVVRGQRGEVRGLVRQPFRLVLSGLLLGGLFFIDLWTVPVALALMAFAAVAAGWRERNQLDWRLIYETASFVSGLLVIAVVLYLPFYFSVPGSLSGLEVNQASLAPVNGFVPAESVATRPVHFLIFWLPVLWLPLSFILRYHLRAGRKSLGRWQGAWAVMPGLLVVLAWGALVLAKDGFGSGGSSPSGLLGEVEVRWDIYNWLTILMLLVFLSVSLLAVIREASAQEPSSALLLAFGLTGTVLLMLLGAEMFRVDDFLGYRGNTVFRFWYQGWLLLAVAGAYGAYHISRSWRFPPSLSIRLTWMALRPLGWAAITICIFASAFMYTALATLERTDGFEDSRGLDGLAYLQLSQPAEYAAVRWLNKNVSGTPTLLEAQGEAYSDYGRIASLTGLPTVLGWPTHEQQWRGGYDDIGSRPEDIMRIYTTTSEAEAMALLRKYDVRYVYVGRLEQQRYVESAPAEERMARVQALQKFEDFMDIVFSEGQVRIYRIR